MRRPCCAARASSGLRRRIFATTARLPLPLAFSPAPCMHRQVGVDALDGAGLDWRVAFTSPSQQGLRAAVLAGLAITALPQGDLEPGMVVIDGQYACPPCPPPSSSCSGAPRAPRRRPKRSGNCCASGQPAAAA